MAVTFLQLTNRVLQVLGEDEITVGVTEISDTYQKLVATFVNQIKEEVEDSHNWRKLRHSVDVTVTAGSNTATITGTNERSRLLREYDPISGIERPLVVDVTTPDQEFPVREADLSRLLYLTDASTVTNSQYSSQFAIDDSSGDTLDLYVYPSAVVNRTYRVNLITPQERIAFDAPQTAITVPVRPIELGALWYALEERGEELGVSGVYSEQKYRKALDDAIGTDAADQGGYNLVPV